MKKRASLRISGIVQMAGFRTFIKQDETIGAIGGVSERIDQNKDEIVTEIGALREDLRTYMAEKLTKIEHE